MIRPAWLAYEAAEEAAATVYLQVWLEKFKALGLVFPDEPNAYGMKEVAFRQYRVTLSVCPRLYRGCKVEVHCKASAVEPYEHWHTVKCVFDSGAEKFMDKLQGNGFV